MINVYIGDIRADKDRFLFQSIANQMPKEMILLVPDQYTLQAERNAFAYLNTDTLLELEIMSRASFSRRILSSQGSPSGTALNKYGRFMLLAKILLEDEQPEGFFAAVNRKSSFITMLNDLIAEMKQSGLQPEDLMRVASCIPEDSDEILSHKLQDLCTIFSRYEERIAGHFTDTEDLQKAVAAKIYESNRVSNTIFWVDGFDDMTHRMLEQIEAIACTAPELNIVLTGNPENLPSAQQVPVSSDRAADGSSRIPERKGFPDADDGIYAITDRLRSMLRAIAKRRNLEYHEYAIPESCRVDAETRTVIRKCSDFYSEAETAAVRIRELVREQGFRYRDFVIICNDTEKRGSVFQRVFADYEIPLFVDHKRKVTQEPAIEFLLSMLDIIRNRRRFEDVFLMLKTGFGPISGDACEELENYCARYHIRGNRWKKEFIYGRSEEGEEGMLRLNQSRKVVDQFIGEAETVWKGCATVREKTEALYRFLVDTVRMPQRLDEIRIRLEEKDQFEYAQTCAQIWKLIIQIFDQLVEILGDEAMGHDEYAMILQEGFEEAEIGLLPPNNDQVLFGTMQRTRTGRMPVLFLAGVNEGVLPEDLRSEGILSDEEKERLQELGAGRLRDETGDTELWFRVGRTDAMRLMEHRLSLARTLHKAGEHLILSYAEMDPDGGELRPSELIREVLEMDPEPVVQRDVLYAVRLRDLTENPQRQEDPGEKIGRIDACEGVPVENPDPEVRKQEEPWKDTSADLDGSNPAMTPEERYPELQIIQTRGGTLPHLTTRLRKHVDGEPLSDVWKAAALLSMGERRFETVKEGLVFQNEMDQIQRKQVRELYGRGAAKDVILSTSAVERYSRCPFSFFVSYGLRPVEERTFDVDMRSIGDIYHDCMKMLAETLTGEGTEITAPDSRWMTVTEEECRILTDRFVDAFADQYREGIFTREGRERYVRDRVKEVCHQAGWTMITQVRAGHVRSIYFEQRFGRGSSNAFPPIRIDLGAEGTVSIEGVIDRIDVLGSGTDDTDGDGKEENGDTWVRIVDYKSGKESFRLDEVRNGWRLQLMIYLKGARGMIREAKPAGVFYFSIREENTDISENASSDGVAIEKKRLHASRLDGIVLNDPAALSGMDAEMDGSSDIIPARRKKDGTYSGNCLLTEEEFSDLIRETDSLLEERTGDLIRGEIPVRPLKDRTVDACRFCAYHGICNYE